MIRSEPLVIFISAVSDEFHKTDPLHPMDFQSYRDVLAGAFRRAGLRFQVIVQEELAQGTGDLLGTLNREISTSRLVIHLVGEMAGALPEPAPVRRFIKCHPEFLSQEPELRDSLGDLSGISYTQWEIYLAIHYEIDRLVFFADPNAPRSRSYRDDPDEMASQGAHRNRLKLTGEHREPFFTQRDLALKCVTSAIRAGLVTSLDAPSATPEKIAAAREASITMITEISGHIKNPNPKSVPAPDPAGVDVLMAAYEAVAKARNLDLQNLVTILDEWENSRRERVQAEPTAAALYDLAFAKVALGDYSAAMSLSRQSAELAFLQIDKKPTSRDTHADEALSAWLLCSEAAEAAGDRAAAVIALESGSVLIDPVVNPLLWADYHAPLASLYMEFGEYSRAEALMKDIVSIYESELSDSDPILADSLLLSSSLLLRLRHDSHAYDLATRAGKIFEVNGQSYRHGMTEALKMQASALDNLGDYTAAESLFRRALRAEEILLGLEHPVTLGTLSGLAGVLESMGKYEESESLYKRIMEGDKRMFGSDHPRMIGIMNDYAFLMKSMGKYEESEVMFRLALDQKERLLGSEHPGTLQTVSNLASVLELKGDFTAAESLCRRALEGRERSLGANHPKTLITLHNFARLLYSKGELTNSEQLYRQTLERRESVLGYEHPDTLETLNGLAELLHTKGDHDIAESLFRQSVEGAEKELGQDHPKSKTFRKNWEQCRAKLAN